MPKQIKELRPFFSRCTDAFFTGFDPPRTLAPAAALAPTTTTEDPKIPTTVPEPSPTPDSGARNTATSEPPTITPANNLAVGRPQKQDTQDSGQEQEPSGLESKPNDSRIPEDHSAQQGSDPEGISRNSQQGDSTNTVPGESKDSHTPFIPGPEIAAGVKNEGSSQNSDPTSDDIAMPVGNVDPDYVRAADNYKRISADDVQQINDGAVTAAHPAEKSPSEVDPILGTTEDPEKNTPSKLPPSAKIAGDPEVEHSNTFDQSDESFGNPGQEDSSVAEQSAKTNTGPENEGLNSKETPGKPKSSDEVTGEYKNESPSEINPSIEGLQVPGIDTASEHDSTGESGRENPSGSHPLYDIAGTTGEENTSNIDLSAELGDATAQGLQGPGMGSANGNDPSLEATGKSEEEIAGGPNPSFEVDSGSGNTNPIDSDPLVSDTGKVRPSELKTPIDIAGDLGKENSNEVDSSFENMGDSNKEVSSNVEASAADTRKENLSELGLPFDFTRDPEEEYSSELDPLFKTTGDLWEDGSSKLDSLGDQPAEQSPNSHDPLTDAMWAPGLKDSTKFDQTAGTSTYLDIGEDPAQQHESDDPYDSPQGRPGQSKTSEEMARYGYTNNVDGLPQQNDEILKIDPFHLTPNQLHRIKAALSLSAQEAQLPPNSAQWDSSDANYHGPPGLFGTSGHRPQTQHFHERLSTQIPNIQFLSVDGHPITPTRTVASGRSRMSLSPATLNQSSNRTLNSTNASANATAKSITSDASGTGLTAGSGIKSPSPTRSSSSGVKGHANTGAVVQVLGRKACIALAMSIFIGMI